MPIAISIRVLYKAISQVSNHLQYHKLVFLLFEESKNVVLQAKLVGEETVLRDQREKYKKHQQRIFQSWEDYEMGEIEPMELLQQCAELNGPVM